MYGDCVAKFRLHPTVSEFPEATSFLVLVEFSGKFKCSWSSYVSTSFLALASRTASFCHPWELDAASRLYSFASSFLAFDQSYRQGALSIPGLFDATGFCTVEELVETVKARFIVGFGFATILSSLSCSCILFAIVLVQLVKLKFWAQQRELKWLMLDRKRRLFHSSRVKFHFVNMSANWCSVSTYLIGILGSKLILSNNQSRATLWVCDTCLTVGLLPLIIILITASLSSKM